MGPPAKRNAPAEYEPPSSYTIHRNKARQKTELELLAHRFSQTPYPAMVLSALNLFSLRGAQKAIRGYPSVMQCTSHTAFFAAAAYALSTGDWINGSGLTAGWSAIWLFFNARNAIRSRRIFPLTMITLVASIGSIYGYSYATIGRE